MRMTVAALVLAIAAGVPGSWILPREAPAEGPEVVAVPAGAWDWRPAGTWRQGGLQVDPPLLRAEASEPLHIMRFQVSRGEYALCVADGACLPADPGASDEPQTGVSWHDATAYADWLSERTGETWRLPTDAEWQRAAAERFADDALGAAGGFADRWLARYEAEAAAEVDAVVRVRGGFGENTLGVSDMGGNVWEWTTDCSLTGTLSGGGDVAEVSEYCGARVAEGRHRAMVIDFVRDASAGGCAAGVPPDHLGFRLVREG